MFEFIGKITLYILGTMFVGGITSIPTDCDLGTWFFGAWATGFIVFMMIIA